MFTTTFIFLVASALFALIYGGITIRSILSMSKGTEEMQAIARAIQMGAKAYLNRQYQVISFVGAVIFLLLLWQMNYFVSVGFAFGAILSGLAGYIGMNISVQGNVRTTQAARKGINEAFQVAFRSGSVTGFLVVGLGLLGLTLYYYFLKNLN